MAYLTAAEFLKRVDARDVGQLVADDNQPVPSSSLATDPNLQAILEDASGLVEVALVTGGRYDPADLEGLTGHSQAALYRVVTDLAMALLFERRPSYDPKRVEHLEGVRRRHLSRLEKGENVFALTAHIDAGKASVDGPSLAEYDQSGMFRDHAAGHYYPRRRRVRGR